MSAYHNRTGVGYDATRRADPHILERLIHHLSLGDRAGEEQHCLDVACGTGNYTIALSGRGGSWRGIDSSSRMIYAARRKTLAVDWCLARAESLPFVDHSFAAAVCTLALHHFADLTPIFREVSRVLASGKLVIFTADPDQMRSYWLNEYFPEAMRKSAEEMPAIDRVMESLTRAGFARIESEIYDVRPDLQDLFLFSGKHRPSLYLDERFRRGISTFSRLAVPGEVESGCARLAEDIESGQITETIERYNNPKGDYLFLIASKGP